MKELRNLEKKGVKIDFICPEYDVFMKVNEVIAFFEGSGDANSHIKIAEGVAHAFPALQPKEFGKIVFSP